MHSWKTGQEISVNKNVEYTWNGSPMQMGYDVEWTPYGSRYGYRI